MRSASSTVVTLEIPGPVFFLIQVTIASLISHFGKRAILDFEIFTLSEAKLEAETHLVLWPV